MTCHRIRLTALLLALAFAAAVSYAAITGTISGTVTDASGAVLPGVTVTVLNQDTGITQTVVSDGRGFYSFPALDVGTYTLGVSRTGFESYKEENIKIDANSAVRADVKLRVGAVTEVIEASANPVQIETQSSQLGEVIESTKMTDMPLNGRSFTDLMLLQPGVSPYSGKAEGGGGQIPAVSGGLNGGNISVNGGREASNGYMVNGADANDGVENATAIIPNLDSIGEFRIITDNFSAEYGNFSGGQVNVVTKSGTNKFHGSGFEFLRNTDFNASNYFDATHTQPSYNQNIYGGTFGGPLKKDKVFFFADFQGTNASIAQTETDQTLSAANRTGDVSDGEWLIAGPQDPTGVNNTTPYSVVGPGWANVLTKRLMSATGQTVTNGEPYDYLALTLNPNTGNTYGSNCTSTTYDPSTGTGCVFPGSIIPQAAWDPVAANLFKYIPAQTPGVTLPASGYQSGTVPAYSNSSLPNTLSDYKESGRVDFNTRLGVLFAYYFVDTDNSVNPYAGGSDGQFPGSTKGRAMLSNVGLTTTFKNNSVNSARISYMRQIWYSVYPDYPLPGPTLASLGFLTPWGGVGSRSPGGISPIDPKFEGVPELSVEGISMGLPDAIDGHFEGTYQGIDNYMKVVGTHTLQVGVDYHFDEIDERNNNENNGDSSFGDGYETGYGAADFLLGAISQGFTQSSDQYLDGRSYYFGAFVEDSWRARPNLTLNYGVRYEITTPWWDTKNRMEGIVQGEQSQVFPNSPLGWVFPGDKGVPRTFASIKYNKFAPRFGFAYTPSASKGPFAKILGGPNHTSIRGGFGVFYTNYQQESSYEEAGDAPYGNFYQASIPSMLYAPFIDRATQNVEAPKFPFNWPPNNVSASNPYSGYNFVNAEPLASSFAVAVTNTVPYLMEYNLGIQRQLGSATVFTVNYVGSQGRHLANANQSNPANPALCAQLSGSYLAPGQTNCGPNLETQTYTLADGTTEYGTDFMNIACGCIGFGENPLLFTNGTSNFNSLQTDLKHTSKMWDFLLGYTYQRSMDTSSSQTGETDFLYPRLAYGESNFNVPQYFTGSYTVHLPFDHWTKNNWGRRIIGGWAVSGVTKLAKGTPVTLRNSGDKSETATNYDVPFYTPGNLFAGSTHGDKNPRHIDPATGSNYPYFNTSLFTREKAGQFGDAHRNFFVGPGLNDTDLALQRFFHIHEANVIQFRAEAFNVFNHTEFGNPSGSVTSSSFGHVTSASNPRILQLAVKYNF